MIEIRAAFFDGLDFSARHGEQVRQRFDARRQLHKFAQPVNGKFHAVFVWGAHAPSRAPFGASPNETDDVKEFSARAPKVRAGLAVARVARALPGQENSTLIRTASKSADRFARTNEYPKCRTKSLPTDPS